MTAPFKAACIQFCADDDESANLIKAESLCREAQAAGADFICLAEYFCAIEVSDQVTLSKAVYEEDHPALHKMQILAKELNCWMQIGSLPIRVSENQVNNRAFLLDKNGEIRARYNKIHLFDVSLKDGEAYHESDAVEYGKEAVNADIPWGNLGMTICYDVRFPYLFRDLAQAGADFITIPAAFTQTTGEAHWHVLTRSRAIENGCYVIATGQSGVRHTGRATYGHSVIIDPWGKVLADAGADEGFIIAEIDPRKVREVREMVPSLQHDRRYVQS